MEFKIASKKVWKLETQISAEDAEKMAVEKKMEAFGTLNKITGIFQKPDPADFELVYKELHYDPFWHVATKAHYVYDREVYYQINDVKAEVKSATIEGKDFQVTNEHLHVPATEHCQNELQDERFIDALNGNKNPGLKEYINKGTVEVKSEDISAGFPKDAIVLPPSFRISAIMREMLASMIKGIQADKIFEENIEVCCTDLYYRPIYTFKFLRKSKNKEGIMEIDGVTKENSAGTRTFAEYLGKAIDREFLFDIGIDAAEVLIPGGGIAVKMAKKVLDTKNK